MTHGVALPVPTLKQALERCGLTRGYKIGSPTHLDVMALIVLTNEVHRQRLSMARAGKALDEANGISALLRSAGQPETAESLERAVAMIRTALAGGEAL